MVAFDAMNREPLDLSLNSTGIDNSSSTITFSNSGSDHSSSTNHKSNGFS